MRSIEPSEHFTLCKGVRHNNRGTLACGCIKAVGSPFRECLATIQIIPERADFNTKGLGACGSKEAIPLLPKVNSLLA